MIAPELFLNACIPNTTEKDIKMCSFNLNSRPVLFYII